jgi:hypothetical protein
MGSGFFHQTTTPRPMIQGKSFFEYGFEFAKKIDYILLYIKLLSLISVIQQYLACMYEFANLFPARISMSKGRGNPRTQATGKRLPIAHYCDSHADLQARSC